MAKVRALAEDAPPPVVTSPKLAPLPEVAFATPTPPDASRPRTIIPIPTFPAVDPQLVRTYEAARRFSRSTNPTETDRNLPAPMRSSARR